VQPAAFNSATWASRLWPSVETRAYPIFIFASDLMSYCAPDLCTGKAVIYQSFSFGAKFVNCAPAS
jgi:hypothetical protein